VSDGAAPAAPTARWTGLDVLRGLSIAAMILVNNPGRWGKDYQYEPLRHAEWHGCTFTDLVFPTFLFCAGVAIVPAMQKRLAMGPASSDLFVGIGRRVFYLILLGLFLSAFPLVSFAADREWYAPMARVRVPGVLQRIGVCYGIAAVLFATVSARTMRLVLVSCLVGWWLVATLVPVPGVGMPDLSAPATTLQGWLDRAVFGSHIWVKGSYDPEGLLSTIPALATCLFGVEAGRLLAKPRATDEKVLDLLRTGTLLLLLGAVWGWVLPINKPLWTSSYAVWTGGIAMLGLGLCVHFFEGRGLAKLAYPFQVYGTNALLVFVGSGVLGRIVGSMWTVDVDGKAVAVKEWFFRTVLLPIGDPRLASLLFSCVWIVGWYVVLRWLYRRRIVWRV
jgi:predicted acyltransferase